MKHGMLEMVRRLPHGLESEGIALCARFAAEATEAGDLERSVEGVQIRIDKRGPTRRSEHAIHLRKRSGGVHVVERPSTVDQIDGPVCQRHPFADAKQAVEAVPDAEPLRHPQSKFGFPTDRGDENGPRCTSRQRLKRVRPGTAELQEVSAIDGPEPVVRRELRERAAERIDPYRFRPRKPAYPARGPKLLQEQPAHKRFEDRVEAPLLTIDGDGVVGGLLSSNSRDVRLVRLV